MMKKALNYLKYQEISLCTQYEHVSDLRNPITAASDMPECNLCSKDKVLKLLNFISENKQPVTDFHCCLVLDVGI